MSRIKTCVSLYSLQCEFMAGTMKLEDVFRYMKELEVEGINFYRIRCFMEPRNPLKRRMRNGIVLWKNMVWI